MDSPSSEVQEVKITTDIIDKINARTPTIAYTLDIEKVFDTVGIDGLLFKMHLLGYINHIRHLVRCYLIGRSFKVIINEHKSAEFMVAAGVPQGGVLSADRYNIFVSDLPVPSNSRNYAIQ